MYTIHKKRNAETKNKDAEVPQKSVSTISSDMTKEEKTDKDFVLTNGDLDLRTILDRRTHTNRTSSQFMGIDNASFQAEKETP